LEGSLLGLVHEVVRQIQSRFHCRKPACWQLSLVVNQQAGLRNQSAGSPQQASPLLLEGVIGNG
jgi:hypothetical protein